MAPDVVSLMKLLIKFKWFYKTKYIVIKLMKPLLTVIIPTVIRLEAKQHIV